jgi:type IV secretory pathway VirB4 component
MIPIFDVEGNKLTSLKGEVSSFFEILPPDLEGFSQEEKERVYDDLERDLINTSGTVKLYWLSGKVFINTFSDLDLSHGEVLESDKPVETFVGTEIANVQFYENYLSCGTDFVRILSIKDFSDRIIFLETLTFHDFVMCFRKIPKLEAKSKINFKRKLHFSALFKGMRDLDSENAYYQAENLLDEVGSDTKALFDCELFLILRAPTKKALDEVTEKTIREYKGKNASLFVEERGLSYFYQTLVPGVPASFKRALQLPSDYLSYLVPFHRDFIYSEGVQLKSRSRNSVYLNIFHEGALNYNCLITGSSGQGKSMMANKLLKYELEQGVKAMVLDLGNSFQKNAKYHGGVVFSEKFNPLQFKNPRYLKEFVLAVLDEKLGKKEEGRLFETISNAEFSTFAEFLSILEESFPGISLYFKEIQGFLTDEKQELNDFTYCDFTLYPESMKAPLIIYLIEYFKSLKGKKIFVFDECWHLLLKNADYIAECFRTFRKHQASAIAISQNLDDFSGSQLGRVIIQNTFFKFLFKQSLNESEFIDSTTVSLLNEIQSKKGDYSEFLYFTEVHKKPVRFYPSPLEYELFTSDRADNNKFDSYMSEKGKFLDFRDAIQNFTEIKNPNWKYYEQIS